MYKVPKHITRQNKNGLFPIRYTLPGVFDKPGSVLREYDRNKYYDLRIFKIFGKTNVLHMVKNVNENLHFNMW
jgi:hypothetical protein